MADYFTRPIQSDRMNTNFGRCRRLEAAGINPRRELVWGMGVLGLVGALLLGMAVVL
jgi:hypothetical protein